MNVSDAKLLKELKTENVLLKRLLAEAMLENEVTKKALRKSGERTGQTRTGALYVSHGLSERRCLRVVCMSASAYRYEPAQDRNCALKDKIIALAQRHRR